MSNAHIVGMEEGVIHCREHVMSVVSSAYTADVNGFLHPLAEPAMLLVQDVDVAGGEMVKGNAHVGPHWKVLPPVLGDVLLDIPGELVGVPGDGNPVRTLLSSLLPNILSLRSVS